MDLDQIRKDIDQIDQELVALLERRMVCVGQIVEYKDHIFSHFLLLLEFYYKNYCSLSHSHSQNKIDINFYRPNHPQQ